MVVTDKFDSHCRSAVKCRLLITEIDIAAAGTAGKGLVRSAVMLPSPAAHLTIADAVERHGGASRAKIPSVGVCGTLKHGSFSHKSRREGAYGVGTWYFKISMCLHHLKPARPLSCAPQPVGSLG